MVCTHHRASSDLRFFNAGMICPSQPGAMPSVLEKLLVGPTFAYDVAVCWWTGPNDSAASMARTLSWRAWSGFVCTNLSAGLLLGLGEIMLGVCALGDREGVTRNNPTTDDNTSLGLDIYIISKTAHPSNTKPHHRKFQIPRRRRPPPP